MAQTHFGYQTVDEAEKARRVRGVFDSVATRYDLMNDLLSAGLHRAWKAYAVAAANVREGEQVLDIAGGTGDLARAFAARVGERGQVVLTDINEAMLRVGRDRLLDEGLVLPTAVCDAERLPFADGRFDLVSVAFGLRNMTHKERALAEMARVLRPGGRLLVLDFSRVAEPLAQALRLVFVQGHAADRPTGRGRCRQLPLPRRIDPHAPGPGDAEGDDEGGRLRPRGRPQPERRRRRAAPGHPVLNRIGGIARRHLAARRRPDHRVEAVLDAARLNFLRLQAAWDAADLPQLARMTTAPLLGELRDQLDLRGPGPNRTEVLSLDARLLGIEELRDAFVARIEFSGLIRERQDDGAAPFRELWMLAKLKTSCRGWQLARVLSLG